MPGRAGIFSYGESAMSIITREPPRSTSRWIPKRLARLTVEQYEAMVDSGIFTKRDRFVLINGFLVDKVPKRPRHTFVAKNLARELGRLLPSGWDIRIEDAVRLTSSKPEPDISVARGDIEDYAERDPEPGDLAMVVEVAASRVTDDRQMASVFGSAGIPVYWIVDLRARQVEVHTLLKRRGTSAYGKPRVFKPGQSIPVLIESKEVGRIAVADIMPRSAPASRSDRA
jgi:Uma2 family endonuclease